MKDPVTELIERVDNFKDWEDQDAFMTFRKGVFSLYDTLTEREREKVDESMVMEHIAMIYSCYGGGING